MKKMSAIALGVFLLIWIGSLILLTGMDVNNLFVYLPRWLIYLIVCALILPFAPGKYWPLKTVLLGIWLMWLLLLPSMRWNTLKAFYIDCANIQQGMTLSEVRQRMTPYVEADNATDFFSAYMAEAPETSAEHNTRILFIPTEVDQADWCVVYPRGQQVKAVVISPD